MPLYFPLTCSSSSGFLCLSWQWHFVQYRPVIEWVNLYLSDASSLYRRFIFIEWEYNKWCGAFLRVSHPEACNIWLIVLHCSVSKLCPTLQSHRLKHTRLLCPPLSPRVCSNSCPVSWWCYLTIASSVIPFSSCLQSFPASGSFPVSQLFASGGQSIAVSASASVLPMNIQGWFPLGLTSLISLRSKGLSRVFSSTTVLQHSALFMVQLSHP